MTRASELTFEETVRGLIAGDFSRLAPLFETQTAGAPSPIIRWYEGGLFDREPQALAEAFTCACFNGCTETVEYFLEHGVDPNGGINTGMNAFHWAANRGQLKEVEILIRHQALLETENSYGGTVLGTAVWSAIYEPKPAHLQIIKALLDAGAKVSASDYPSGNQQVDELLRPFCGTGGVLQR